MPFFHSQFKRSAKTGKAVWIQACYNPIFDMNGKPFKVVKYATDITAQIAFMDDVRRLIGQMDDAIKNANQQAAGAAVAATETSQTVQTVASGAEEMSASVAEISQSMANSMEAVIVAKSQTDNADMSAQKLTQAAKAMEGIVQLIQNIAGQINLLALNATIEAARAGDAGKGFAVVADEVKTLAKQASDATEQINTEIAATQSIAREVVGALGEIRNKVDGVQQYVSGTASAVEEQNAVTREISSNMQQASLAVEDINQSVSKIASAIHAASASVAATQAAANAMRR